MALDYRAYVEQVINRKDYLLDDMESKINRLWLDGKLTEADRDELLQLAAENAPESLQIDFAAKFADIDARLFALEHPTDIYPIWEPGYVTKQHEIVRFDVTGDGQLDLCQYNGGRASTSLGIGKIQGWQLLNIELVPTHNISRDSSGGYVLTPIDSEPETDENEG